MPALAVVNYTMVETEFRGPTSTCGRRPRTTARNERRSWAIRPTCRAPGTRRRAWSAHCGGNCGLTRPGGGVAQLGVHLAGLRRQVLIDTATVQVAQSMADLEAGLYLRAAPPVPHGVAVADGLPGMLFGVSSVIGPGRIVDRALGVWVGRAPGPASSTPIWRAAAPRMKVNAPTR